MKDRVEKRDIENREDLLFLMEEFYVKLLQDDLLQVVFIDIAHIDLKKHLPVLANFWDHILFNKGNYKGNPLQVHMALHEKLPLTKLHFDTWLSYFMETVDEHFEGEKAFMAKMRAESIAGIMQNRIYVLENQNSHE